MSKYKIVSEGGRTHIYVDETEIDDCVAVDFHHDNESLPTLDIKIMPRNLELIGDGSPRFYADDPKAKRYINGKYGYREGEIDKDSGEEVEDEK